MEGREIDLIDLIVEILYRWKGMVLSAVIGAVLLGGLSYYRSMEQVKSTAYTALPALEAKDYLENSLSTADKIAARRAASIETSYRQYEDYLKESVLMKLDPTAIPQVTLIYSVDAKDKEEAEAVTALYLQVLRSGELAEKLAAVDETLTPASASELIQASGAYDREETVQLSQFKDGKVAGTYPAKSYDLSPSASFSVILRNTTLEKAVKMADTTGEYIENLPSDGIFNERKHTCALVSRTEGITMDASLMEYQKMYRDSVYSADDRSVAPLKDKLSGSGLAYYNALMEIEEQQRGSLEDVGETQENVAMMKASVSKKYVVIGFAAGLFVFAGIYLISYLLNLKLHYTDDLGVMYGISRIASVPDDKKWNRSAYAGWLRSIRDRGKRAFTRDKAVELAGAGIRELMNKKEIESVCIIGCGMEEKTADIRDGIVKALSAANLKAEAIDNILYDAEAFHRFCSYEGVVLFEKAGGTLYDEIKQELNKISEQGMILLGAVIIE